MMPLFILNPLIFNRIISAVTTEEEGAEKVQCKKA